MIHFTIDSYTMEPITYLGKKLYIRLETHSKHETTRICRLIDNNPPKRYKLLYGSDYLLGYLAFDSHVNNFKGKKHNNNSKIKLIN